MQPVSKKPKKPESKSHKKYIVLALIALLVIAGMASAILFRSDPKERLKELREELSSDKAKDLTEEQRRERYGQMRQAYESLSPDDRAEMERQRDKRDDDAILAFMAKPRTDQLKQIDKDIQESEKRRKEFEQRRKEWEQRRAAGGQAGQGGQGGQGGGPSGRGGPPGVGGSGGGTPGASGTPSGSNQAQAGSNNSGSGRKERTPEERDQRRRQRLTSSSPETRATRTEYTRMVNDRRTQLGLQPTRFARPPGSRGFGGGGGPPGGSGGRGR